MYLNLRNNSKNVTSLLFYRQLTVEVMKNFRGDQKYHCYLVRFYCLTATSYFEWLLEIGFRLWRLPYKKEVIR